jgi:hypothetical protein
MRALAQYRGTRLIEARELSRYIGFILRVLARVRVQVLVGFVLGAGFCKNRDKQLTHIVRVSTSIDYFYTLLCCVVFGFLLGRKLSIKALPFVFYLSCFLYFLVLLRFSFYQDILV